MLLSSSNGSVFEMTVAGYEFPLIQNQPYDSDWLFIRIHVVHPNGEWRSTNPCLLTYEVEDLARWFDAIAEGERVETEQSFIEPNLLFRLQETPEGTSLRVYFELESRPEWAASRFAGEEDLFVELPLAGPDLARAAKELRAELAQYPQRAAL